MENQNRREYDPEFKRNTVLLTLQSVKTVREVADNLGINKDLIYQWRKKLIQKGALAFPGNGAQPLNPDQQKVKELEKKLKDVEMERDILTVKEMSLSWNFSGQKKRQPPKPYGSTDCL